MKISTITFLNSLFFATCLQFTIIPTVQGQVTDGLYAEYLFDDGSANATVGSVDGIPYNVVPAEDRFGCAGRAMEFIDTGSSHINLGDSFDELFATPDTSFSFSFWFKLRDGDESGRMMIAKNAHDFCSENQRQFFIWINTDSKMMFKLYTSLPHMDHMTFEGSTVITDQQWHHTVINYDGSNDTGGGTERIEIYLDNVPETVNAPFSGGTITDIQNGTAQLGIGRTLSSTGDLCEDPGLNQRFDGYMDDFKFYNRTLNSSEVDLLYNYDLPCNTEISDNDNGESVFVIFPNPVNETISIQTGLQDDHYEVKMMDMLGRTLYNGLIESSISTISVGDLAPGKYLVKVTMSNGRSITKSFVKK